MPQVNEFSWSFLLTMFFFFFMLFHCVTSFFFEFSINKNSLFDLYYFNF